MPRFSEKAIDLFTTITYMNSSDSKDMVSLLKTIDTPLDTCFVSFSLLRHLFYGQRQTEGYSTLLNIEKINSSLKDDFISIMVHLWFANYYHGINSPSVDLHKTDEHLTKATKLFNSFEPIDEWESKFLYYGYHLFVLLTQTHQDRNIEEIQSLVDFYDQFDDDRFNPDKGTPRIILGVTLYFQFQFIRGKQIFMDIINTDYFHPGLQIWACGNIAEFEFDQGNLDESLKYSIIEEKLSRETNSYITLQISLDIQANVYWEKENYTKAEKLLKESLTIRMNQNDEFYIFIGYYNLFRQYYDSFRVSKNKKYLEKAKNQVSIMKETFKHSNNTRVVDFISLSESIINKHGSLLQRGLALKSLLELKNRYERVITIKIHIIDLLFDELILSEDKEEISKEISKIMDELEVNDYRNNPYYIFDYVSQQMLVARYYYYIHGKKEKALKIYWDLLEKLEKLNLPLLLEKVRIDHDKMQNEFDSWNKLLSDKDITDKIKETNFKNYINEGIAVLRKSGY